MRSCFSRELLSMALALSTLGLSGTSVAQGNNNQGLSPLAQQGFAISPVPKAQLKFDEENADLVGRGSYLVNAIGGCSGCHTFPAYLLPGDKAGSNPAAGDPFLDMPVQSPSFGPLIANYNVSHYLAGGQCFGPFMARNLTPEVGVAAQFEGKPEGLTEAEFVKVMRTGADIHCDPEHEPSDPICALGPPVPAPPAPDRLQVMPWPTFHNMTDADLQAIYAYLTALPPATACNTPADGCPVAPASYAYANTADCPNPALPQ